jgi:hypothetical protein
MGTLVGQIVITLSARERDKMHTFFRRLVRALLEGCGAVIGLLIVGYFFPGGFVARFTQPDTLVIVCLVSVISHMSGSGWALKTDKIMVERP